MNHSPVHFFILLVVFRVFFSSTLFYNTSSAFIDVKINFLFLAIYSIFPLQLILIESMLRVCKILIWRKCMSQFFKVIFKMIFFLERIKMKKKLYGYLNVFFTIGNKSDFLEHLLKKKWLNIIIFFYTSVSIVFSSEEFLLFVIKPDKNFLSNIVVHIHLSGFTHRVNHLETAQI